MAGNTSEKDKLVLETTSVEETIELGRTLANVLRVGDVVALVGPLGAGKTYLIKGLVAGLGGAETRLVRSPSFVIVNQYPCRREQETFTVNHIDAYRLRNPAELSRLGTEELFAEEGIALVEWADKVMELLPTERLIIRLSHQGEHARRFELAGWRERLKPLPKGWIRRWTITTASQ